jgi:hypothetical protein
MSIARVATVLLASVVLLAGCGGSSAHRAPPYVREVDAVAGNLDSVTNDLYTPSDTSSAASELVTVQAALRKAAKGLAAISPPPAVRADHERLVQAVTDLARGVTPLIAQLKTGNIEGADAAFSLRAAGEARRAIAAIRAAGYEIDVPLLG